VVEAHQKDDSDLARITAIDKVIGERGPELLALREAYLNGHIRSHRRYLLNFYRSAGSTLFHFLNTVPLRSAINDNALFEALDFLRRLQHRQSAHIVVSEVEDRATPNKIRMCKVNLDCIPNTWWPLVTQQSYRDPRPEKVNRVISSCVPSSRTCGSSRLAI